MISLLYCGNSKVFDGLMISLLSIANHASQPLDVHVLTMEITEVNPLYTALTSEQIDFLERILKKKNSLSRVTRHDLSDEFIKEMKNSPNMDSAYTPYTLLRLFSDMLNIPDRVIYLDTDTVAVGDISDLYNYEMRGCDFCGVRDFLGRVFINPRYINAGVLLLDIKRIREDGFFEKTRKFCAQKKTPFPDQDAINRIAQKKCFLPRKYNEQYCLKKDTVIRHFSKTIRWLPYFHTVNIKPWQIDLMHNVYHTYDFDDVLDEYKICIDEYKNFQHVKMS